MSLQRNMTSESGVHDSLKERNALLPGINSQVTAQL
jgi:hypothetical protein